MLFRTCHFLAFQFHFISFAYGSELVSGSMGSGWLLYFFISFVRNLRPCTKHNIIYFYYCSYSFGMNGSSGFGLLFYFSHGMDIYHTHCSLHVCFIVNSRL